MNHRERTKKDYGLNDKQYDEHCKLMDMPMNRWPKGLYEYVYKYGKKVGLCGEVIVVAVAEWIKRGRKASTGSGH